MLQFTQSLWTDEDLMGILSKYISSAMQKPDAEQGLEPVYWRFDEFTDHPLLVLQRQKICSLLLSIRIKTAWFTKFVVSLANVQHSKERSCSPLTQPEGLAMIPSPCPGCLPVDMKPQRGKFGKGPVISRIWNDVFKTLLGYACAPGSVQILYL